MHIPYKCINIHPKQIAVNRVNHTCMYTAYLWFTVSSNIKQQHPNLGNTRYGNYNTLYRTKRRDLETIDYHTKESTSTQKQSPANCNG